MCCLKYEQDVYEEINERVPGVGSVVSTPLGNGTVIYTSILKEKVKVKIEKQNDTEIVEFDAKNIKVVKKERPKSIVPELEEKVDEKELKQLED
jgi:cell fate regulator YaaT (PSP1 superfamily)